MCYKTAVKAESCAVLFSLQGLQPRSDPYGLKHETILQDDPPQPCLCVI